VRSRGVRVSRCREAGPENRTGSRPWTMASPFGAPEKVDRPGRGRNADEGRGNAIIAAPLLVAYVAWPARFEWKRSALLFVPALLAGYGIIEIVYYEILSVHRNNPLHQVFVFDLGGITYITRENQFPVSWSADGYEDALLITRCYEPDHWDSYWTLDPCRFVMNRLENKDDVVFGTPRLAESWLKAVAEHPLAYLGHRLTYLWTFLAGANTTLELERLHLVDRLSPAIDIS
jgi:hypothetical protein